jgi:hypothetical protein
MVYALTRLRHHTAIPAASRHMMAARTAAKVPAVDESGCPGRVSPGGDDSDDDRDAGRAAEVTGGVVRGAAERAVLWRYRFDGEAAQGGIGDAAADAGNKQARSKPQPGGEWVKPGRRREADRAQREADDEPSR